MKIFVLVFLFLVCASEVYTSEESGLPHLEPVSQDELQMLIDYAKYNSISSCNPDSILNWSCGPLCDSLQFTKVLGYFCHQSTDGAFYVAERFVDAEQGHNLIVSFRGSTTLENWIEDLKFLQFQMSWEALSPNIYVHRGFFETYQSLLPQLTSLILKGKENVTKVIFTGHSLGGALASLAMVDFVRQGILSTDLVQLVTFGSPRVGNSEWAKYFQSKFNYNQSIRVVYLREIVPHLPFSKFPFFPYYNHIVREWFWPPDNANGAGFKCSQSNSEDGLCSDGYFDYSILDHLYFQNVIFGCHPHNERSLVNKL
jgi:predicted lipase